MTRGARVRVAAFALLAAVPLPASDLPQPWVDRVVPLGARSGSTVTVELHGRFLSNVTDVRFDSAELGRVAIRNLLERVEKPKLPPRNVMLPGFLHLGQSSGPVRKT